MSLNLFNRDYSLSFVGLSLNCLQMFLMFHIFPPCHAVCSGNVLWFFLTCFLCCKLPSFRFLFVCFNFISLYQHFYCVIYTHRFIFVRSFVACRFYDEKFTRPRTNEIKSKRYLSFGIANQQMDGMNEWMEEGMDERVNVIQHNQQLNWYLTCFKIIIIKSIVNNRITINATLFK